MSGSSYPSMPQWSPPPLPLVYWPIVHFSPSFRTMGSNRRMALYEIRRAPRADPQILRRGSKGFPPFSS